MQTDARKQGLGTRQHNAQPILLQIMKFFVLKVHSYPSDVIYNVKCGQYIGCNESHINGC